MNENNLMTAHEEDGFIVELTNQNTCAYCSMQPETEQEEAILFNAMNNPDKRLADCINMVIEVSHIFCESVRCTNRETGEVYACPRTVLIDSSGKSYQCVSLGVFSAIKKVMLIKGEPKMWKKPVKLKVSQISKDTKKMLTLDMV